MRSLRHYFFGIWVLFLWSCAVIPVLAVDAADDEEGIANESTDDVPQILSVTERLHDQYLEALDYYQGIKVVPDEKKAFALTSKLAEAGSFEAQHLLAYFYEEGIGVSSSSRHAMRCLEKAAEQGCMGAMFDLALVKYYGKGGTKRDYAGAYTLLEKVVNTPELGVHTLNQGEQLYQLKPHAFFILGSMHHEGQGVKKDITLATDYLKKAATHGHLYAQILLFVLYSEGDEVEADQEKANSYLHLAIDGLKDKLNNRWHIAAYMGFSKEKASARVIKESTKSAAIAQREIEENIANRFKSSKKRKPVESALWFLFSAESGHAESMTTYGTLCYKGVGVEQNSAEARSWFEKAAKAKDGLGSYNLAIMLRSGEGGAVDTARADELLWSAARENILPAIRFIEDSTTPLVILSPEEYVASIEDFLPSFAATKLPIHVRAYHCLAECYFTGYGVKKDMTEAVNYWKRAGSRDYAPANARLADFYFYLWPWQSLVDCDMLDDCTRYARKAAEGGDADGAFRYAYILSNREQKPDTDMAIRYYKLAVEKANHAAAANNLGVLLNDNTAKYYDPKAALAYYQIGVDKDEPISLYNMGRILLARHENEADRELALNYLRRSAEADYPEGQLYLAELYLYGKEGVAVDLKEGVFWLSEGANLGYKPAINALAKLMLEGPAEFRDPAKAEFWYSQLLSFWNRDMFFKIAESAESAGEFGQAYQIYQLLIDRSYDDNYIARARYRLALLLDAGNGCTPDPVKARKLYAKAARYGLPEAHCNYGRVLYLGIGGKVDKTTAIKHLNKAINAGNNHAQLTLGTLYMMDETKPALNEAAMKLLRAAAEKDNLKAQCYLGIAYLKAEPHAPDAAEARKWLELAAKAGYEPAVKALRILDKKEGRLPPPAPPNEEQDNKATPDSESSENKAPKPKAPPSKSQPHSGGSGVPA
ncbi:MAG: tetratricopeptide repeat protein [Verrucomicrobiota bacterium]|nr:tetratricopeptide repeat protein [Verrucomicrobiota bacterium]